MARRLERKPVLEDPGVLKPPGQRQAAHPGKNNEPVPAASDGQTDGAPISGQEGDDEDFVYPIGSMRLDGEPPPVQRPSGEDVGSHSFRCALSFPAEEARAVLATLASNVLFPMSIGGPGTARVRLELEVEFACRAADMPKIKQILESAAEELDLMRGRLE